MTTDNRTSVFIEEQFPLFARSSGQKLINFIKKYYESQEQANNYIEAVKNLLSYQDIDTAPEDYFEYIAREIIPSIPERLIANRDLLAKHIKEVYRVRGAPEGYRILFRVLFGEEIDLYNPGDDILRASDGRWIEEVGIKIFSTLTGDIFDLPGVRIVGETSGASAIVDRIETNIFSGTTQFTVYLLNETGTFILGEIVNSVDNSISFKISAANIGPLISTALTEDGGHSHVIGDRVTIAGSPSGSGAQGTVLRTRADSAAEFYVANGGAGYSVNTVLNVPATFGSGQDASFIVTEIGEPFELRDIYDDFIEYIATVTIGDSDTIYTTFIENSANCQLSPVDDFISKTDHGYDDGDKVYFYFFAGNTSYTGIDDSETTVNPYYVYNSNNIAFQVVTTPGSTSPENILDTADAQVSQASANLALANLNSTIVSSLGTSQVNTGTVISISTTDNGYGYYSGAPIGTVTFGQIAEQQLTDGENGGILGENADIQSNYLTGTIAQISVDIQGDNYINDGNITLVNATRNGTRDAIAIASSSAIIRFKGRYIDTKGWLSWDKYLQDNFYYQEFSYEIRSEQNLVEYESTVLETMHPAGTKLFGAVYLQDELSLISLEGLDQEIDQWIQIASNNNVTMEFQQSIPFGRMSGLDGEDPFTEFSGLQDSDLIHITNSTSTDGAYRVADIGLGTANTIFVYDTESTIKLPPTQELTSGYEFNGADLINSVTGFPSANVNNLIFVTNATNVNNNGGPFIVQVKSGGTLTLGTLAGGPASFITTLNDTTAKIEIRKEFNFSSNSVSTCDFTVYRYSGNTYPYSNNVTIDLSDVYIP